LRLSRAAGGSVQVPLEKVYVVLKADRTNPLERAEARRALEVELQAAIEAGQFTPEDAQNARWYVVAGSPIMPSLESRDHRGGSEQAEVLTLGDAYRLERREASLQWLVVRFHPESAGSGAPRGHPARGPACRRRYPGRQRLDADGMPRPAFASPPPAAPTRPAGRCAPCRAAPPAFLPPFSSATDRVQ
jgi:hypothetical protein